MENSKNKYPIKQFIKNAAHLRKLVGERDWNNYLNANDALLNKKSLTSEERKVHARISNCFDIMESFGDNYWWESDDKRVIAYHQFLNPVLLVDLTKFQESAEFLLGRPIYTHEYGLNWNRLREEAERAYYGKPAPKELPKDVHSFGKLVDIFEKKIETQNGHGI